VISDRNKNIAIGIFILSACMLVIWALLTFKPRSGDGQQSIRVLFSNVDKITPGTQVTYAGKPVGEVVAINPVDDALKLPPDQQGRPFVYLVQLKIDSAVRVTTADEITVATSGLLGDRYVAIVPREPKQGEPSEPVDGKVLRADSSDNLEKTVTEVGQLAQSMGVTLRKIDMLIDENATDIRRSVADLATILADTKRGLQILHDKSTFEGVADSVLHIKSITASLDSPEQLKAIIDNVTKISADLADISQKLQRGEGTLGALIAKDGTYDKLNQVLEQAEITMKTINRYGLLFQNDKRWQRLQKANSATCSVAGDAS